MNTGFLGLAVATVLTACGIETDGKEYSTTLNKCVATVLTACGIETDTTMVDALVKHCCNSTYRLRY